MTTLFELLQAARSLGASDLHLAVGRRPMVRLCGLLEPLKDFVTLSEGDLVGYKGLLPEQAQTQLSELGEADCALVEPAGERSRVNVYREACGYAMTIRLLPKEIPSWEALGLPASVIGFTALAQGLVLVTGATGSGKSTTLASLLNKLNRERPCHIITLEEPIEYRYTSARALVSQREVGRDTRSFASGLRSALREDPDVILVGELRDGETIGTALAAAETGHLVFATLHTRDAVGSINRILDSLPENQAQVRAQLAECLQGVVAQQLLPRADGTGLVAAFEVLLATDALRTMIREGRTHQLSSYLETGSRYGMLTMSASISKLRQQGLL